MKFGVAKIPLFGRIRASASNLLLSVIKLKTGPK